MTVSLHMSPQHRLGIRRTTPWRTFILATAMSVAASSAQASISWDGEANSNWWFNPTNWNSTGSPNNLLPPNPQPVATSGDAQISIGTSGAWNVTGEGVVYDPDHDPWFNGPSGIAANLVYQTSPASALMSSTLMRNYGPQTLYRLYIARNTTTANLLTIKSGDLAIESTTIIGRSGSTASALNLGKVVQTGGLVRLPLTGLDLAQRETSGWGNGTWDYQGGTLEVSQESTQNLRLSAGSAGTMASPGPGAGGYGRMIIRNPTTGGHVRTYNAQISSYSGNSNDPAFDALDPDGITTGVGIVEFHFQNGNTRPMQVINNLSINNGLEASTGGTRSSRLSLVLDEAPSAPGGIPQSLALFDVDSDGSGAGNIQGTGSLGGTFSSADGLTNYPAGAVVSAIFGATKYNWSIRYSGNITWAVGQQNDSVIESISATGGRDIVLEGLSTEAATSVPGDYNNDGTVDAADYVVWRDNRNTVNVLPNDPFGPIVDVAQYDLWKKNFGVTVISPALGAAAVPEPSTLLLVLVAATGALSVRGRRCEAN